MDNNGKPAADWTSLVATAVRCRSNGNDFVDDRNSSISSDFRVKSESCAGKTSLNMNFGEKLFGPCSAAVKPGHAPGASDHAEQRPSSSSSSLMQKPETSVIANGDNDNINHDHDDIECAESAPSSAPLDFSLKKRRLHETKSTPAPGKNVAVDNNKNGSSAFEAVVAGGHQKAPAFFGNGGLHSASSFLLNPAAALATNFGSGSTNGSQPGNGHFSSQKLCTNAGGGNVSLLAQHLAGQSQQSPAANKNGGNQRPFKVYDPMKPGSVLNVNSFMQPSPMPLLHHNLTSASSLLNTTGPSPHSPHHAIHQHPQQQQQQQHIQQQMFSDQLLAQYCQYLLSTQTLASLNNNGSTNNNNKIKSMLFEDVVAHHHHHHQQHQPLARRDSHRSVITTPGVKNGGATVSPPQVTSTSHPHIDSCATPPASCGLDSSSSSVSTVGDNAKSSPGNDNNGNGNDNESSNHNNDDDDYGANDESPTPNGVGGAASVNGRRRGKSLPDELKDEAYWERRRKNNEAAKRSRDLRRAKEDEIALRAALLEQENARLRVEVAALKTETEKLRQMLLNT